MRPPTTATDVGGRPVQYHNHPPAASGVLVHQPAAELSSAAMLSQANTGKLLADNPTLMRLRELEILESVAASSKLNIVLGEKGLADRVVNVL